MTKFINPSIAVFSRASRKYFLEFDERIRWGSAEHFFHFMWGYLLPALHEIATIESDADLKKYRRKYYFRSCGPVINKLINEMLSLYEYDYKIVREHLPGKLLKRVLGMGGNFTKIAVPRWDLVLRDADPTHKIQPDLITSMKAVKAITLRKIDKSFIAYDSDYYSDNYLILKRSSQPKFYKEEGKAEIHGYGTARRDLSGTEDAARSLRERNIPVKVFEPGKYTLSQQIKIFQNCKGIVAIRGAEFANLIWMKPKTKVILIQPSSMDDVRVQKTIAVNLDLDYYEIITDGGMHPTLDADAVYEYLRQ